MIAMAKKKSKAIPRRGKPLNVWLENDLREAVETARHRSRRKLRAEVSVALEEYLTRLGLWPPPTRKPGKADAP